MAIELVFETHCTTVDNEQGRATGWLPGRLSEQGRLQGPAAWGAAARPRRATRSTRYSGSDLARAAETATIAFAGTMSLPAVRNGVGQRNAISGWRSPGQRGTGGRSGGGNVAVGRRVASETGQGARGGAERWSRSYPSVNKRANPAKGTIFQLARRTRSLLLLDRHPRRQALAGFS